MLEGKRYQRNYQNEKKKRGKTKENKLPDDRPEAENRR